MTALLNEESLKLDLGRFPSTFDFDLTNLTKVCIKFTLRKLEDDWHSTGKHDTEYIQISNFLSYLYFLLDDNKNAIQYVNESLEKDPHNITANANKARFHLEAGEISEVEDIIRKLNELERREDYHKRTCYAEADLAYAYARSGPWYHQKAVELYTRVLEAYPSEYAWQYGLGLALLRQTHCFNSQADGRFNPIENKKTTAHAAELFHDVGTKANDPNLRLVSQADDKFNPGQEGETRIRAVELFYRVATESDDPHLRANAYAKLGKALVDILKSKSTNVSDEIMCLTPKEYFEKAVEMCPDEPSVLATCGQFARYRGELDTSEKLLRRSLQIKPTCHAYHHLALTLKRRVEHSHLKGAYNFSMDSNANRRGGRYTSGFGEKGRQSFEGGIKGSSPKHDSRNENWRRNKGSSRGCMTGHSDKARRNLRQLIKSPLSVRVYPGNKHLSEAIELLEKTEELSEYALNIQYDKGIIYRMLGQVEKAVEVFKSIITKKKYYPTEFLMTNVYEQLGLCLLELSKSVDIGQHIQQKYKKDGQANLCTAVQLQSKTVANDPQFKEAWNSYPTLKQLFSDDREGKPRQLAVLHMLMGDHRDSIDVYNELFIKENEKMAPGDCVNLLKCYQKEGKFEECGFLLRTWECTTRFSDLPPSSIFDVYIDCAFHAYTMDNTQLAYQHFRRAFKVYGLFDKTIEDHAEVDECETKKDILILHTCPHDSECKHPRNLGTILEDVTGLRYTINSDDVLPNQLELTSVVSFIQNIPCVIIMTHESADSYHPLFVDQAIQRSSEQSGLQLLVVSDDKCNIPDIIKTKPSIRMPPLLDDTMDPKQQIPEVHQNWIKEFISLLKPK